MPLYALSIAHTNDFCQREMVAASSGLQLAGGIGLTIGPILGGLAIDIIELRFLDIFIPNSHQPRFVWDIQNDDQNCCSIRRSRKHCASKQ